jgi:hypothetical protein
MKTKKQQKGRSMKKTFTVLSLLFLISRFSFGQVDDRFSFLGASEIKNFGKPLVTSFGMGMNSCSYYSAHISKTFGFSIGIRGMMILIPDDQKTFTPNLPTGYFSTNGNEQTATFFGENGGIYAGPQGIITYPSGINESAVPLIFPQATVSFMGTELLLRYVPLKIETESITLFGIGVRHSISQYIPLFPIDLAVGILYNKFTIGDIVKSSNLAFNAEASRSFGLFTAYGGLQYESSSLTFSYEIKQDPFSGNPEIVKGGKVSADVDGDNKVRMTIGGALSLGLLIINADYSIGSQSVASTGLTFEF